MNATTFLIPGPAHERGAADIARTLEDVYRPGAATDDMPVGLCLIDAGVVGGAKGREATMSFLAQHKQGGPAESEGANEAGVNVFRWGTDHSLNFNCVAPRRGTPLRISATFRGGRTRDRDLREDQSLADDYLTLVHSAARSIAGALGCEGGGGLPERFTELQPYVQDR
ncbi:hypothetical protein AB0D45_21105 [Streptomyces sp. NPDC048352]|uniref:hypothetical protein n=1 Tax=Streptomyces sp. NPDC048352 TaxID=3154718 RepID=UPI003432CB2B